MNSEWCFHCKGYYPTSVYAIAVLGIEFFFCSNCKRLLYKTNVRTNERTIIW